MPRGDGTGPDGNGPKTDKKGWPKRDGTGKGQGQGNKLGKRKRDGSCKINK